MLLFFGSLTVSDDAFNHRRARVAALVRHRGTDDPTTADESRALRMTSAERYISELVAAAPPLSEVQRARLAALLLSARRDGGD